MIQYKGEYQTEVATTSIGMSKAIYKTRKDDKNRLLSIKKDEEQ